MKQYTDLLRHIISNGRVRPDRTKTGTTAVFGYQMRFDLNEGLPLVTEKKVSMHAIQNELFWFLSKSCNNEDLRTLTHGADSTKSTIWDEWALPEDVVVDTLLSNGERAALAVSLDHTPSVETVNQMTQHLGAEAVSAKLDVWGVPKYKHEVVLHKGDLGPIYPKQWRSWQGADNKTIDQIAGVVKSLKENPFSRRHIVSAWNPADLPDESVSPIENVKNGKMALAPCHALFQFFVDEATELERSDWAWKHYPLELTMIVEKELAITLAYIHDATDRIKIRAMAFLPAECPIPKYRLSCQLYQRSTDAFLGLPYNIASYSLLTMMMAQCVDMMLGDFVWTGGDTHLYSNHKDQVEELLTREARSLPTLILNPEVKDIFKFNSKDITLHNYNPHSAISAPVAI